MSETAIPEPQPAAPPRRRRWWLWVLAAVVPALAVLVGTYLYVTYSRDRELREAVAEADRLDPGWRFDDLQAARPDVPDAENGALLVAAAAGQRPGRWPAAPAAGGPELEERLADVVLPARPDDADVKQLRTELGVVAPALGVARDLADRPRGRHTVAWTRDLISTMVPHIQQVRDVVVMLSLDALLRSLDGDTDGALRSCRAALNAGRSVGDEPVPISQFIRASCARRVVRTVEAVLAHGRASPKSLQEMQEALAEEAEEPCQLISARAERVNFYCALQAFRSGRVNRQTFGMRSTLLGPTGDQLIDGTRARACQADYLHYDNQLVEIAKLPAEEQQARLKALQLPSPRLPLLLEALSRDTAGPGGATMFHRTKAELRCAATALAAERYRLAKGNWPERLDGLVADYLAAVPTDPFDGQPLRLRRMDDGILIYSVGPDGSDNGGNLDRKNPTAAGTDLGIRLWDPERRK